MSGNKGLNVNQNHYAHSANTTRVLQPPGGASSFSLWDHSGGNRSAKNSYVTSSYGTSKPSTKNAPVAQNDYKNEYVGGQSQKVGNNRSNIPGIENHYESMRRDSQSVSTKENIPSVNNYAIASRPDDMQKYAYSGNPTNNAAAGCAGRNGRFYAANRSTIDLTWQNC